MRTVCTKLSVGIGDALHQPVAHLHHVQQVHAQPPSLHLLQLQQLCLSEQGGVDLDCCSRLISRVKCINHGAWIPEPLSCGRTVFLQSSYSLLNPASSKSGMRKPKAGDSLHPTKSDIIRAKPQLLSYVFKPAKDELQIRVWPGGVAAGVQGGPGWEDC